MERRGVGSTGLSVSLLGFGCAPIASRAGFTESRNALKLAREHGVSFFDTADMYGVGGSERTIGRVLGGERDKLVISTKCGFAFSTRLKAMTWLKPLLRPLVRRLKGVRASAGAMMASQRTQNFAPAYIEQCVHASLARLGTDRIDIFFLHEPEIGIVDRADTFAKLADLKRAGKIRQYGVSAVPEVVAKTLTHSDYGITVIQTNASLHEPDALRTVLPTCRERGIGFIAGQPLAHGRIFENELLKESLREAGLPNDHAAISSLALRYLRSFVGISAILPSMMKPDHLRANVAAVDAPSLSEKELAAIAASGAPLPSEAVPC